MILFFQHFLDFDLIAGCVAVSGEKILSIGAESE
jgi:hypothetical protein